MTSTGSEKFAQLILGRWNIIDTDRLLTLTYSQYPPTPPGGESCPPYASQ